MNLHPDRSVTLTKEEAARRQISQAIELFFAGDLACSITLSGAAEGCISEIPGQDSLWHRMKADGRVPICKLNKIRDWLKHASDTCKPLSITIERTEAVIMILRCVTKFEATYGATEEFAEFEVWLRSQHPEWIDPSAR